MRGSRFLAPRVTLTLAVAIAVAAAACGCSVRNPWLYAEPPAIDAEGLKEPPPLGRTVIAVEPLGNPASSPAGWSNVGAGMTEIVRRALLNGTDFDVRIQTPPKAQSPAPARDRGGAARVDYLLTGRVTDFNHTSNLPREIRRWGFFGLRTEAVAAIEFRLLDVRRGEVVAADHVYGACNCGRKPVKDQYVGLDVNSYVFWSTPLGRASGKAVDRLVKRVRELVPPHSGDPTITAVSGRRVSLLGGTLLGVAAGQDYFVYIAESPGDAPHPVSDPDTGLPLGVRIERARPDGATAWLRGSPPAGCELRGAVLRREGPPGVARGERDGSAGDGTDTGAGPGADAGATNLARGQGALGTSRAKSPQ